MFENNAAKRMSGCVAATGLDYGRAVEDFYEPLYKFAFGLTGSESDAADLTQETYQVLLVKGGQIRDLQKLRSWLFTTIYRRFLGQRRHDARFPKVHVETVAWRLPAVDSGTDGRMDANAAGSALQALDEKYRAPLVLFYLQDLSYREIASTLGIPIGTVMSRLARGKDCLRKQLATAEPGGFVRPSGYVTRTGNPDSFVGIGGHL